VKFSRADSIDCVVGHHTDVMKQQYSRALDPERYKPSIVTGRGIACILVTWRARIGLVAPYPDRQRVNRLPLPGSAASCCRFGVGIFRRAEEGRKPKGYSWTG